MATLTVGAGQQYTTIAAAIAATQDGDVVLVQAGTYVNDFATIYHKITLRSVGGMATLQATVAPPNGKAILTTETDITIDGFGFTGAFCADRNGAGIRYEGGKLVVANSVFWNNQDGILANPDPNGTILIEGSEFSHNGAGDGGSHGIYVNALQSLTIVGSYFHDAVVGHEIKSRASRTVITGTRIFDNANGTASYSVDLPNGGVAVLTNNIIEKGPNTQNRFSIHYGGEATPPPGSSLTVSGNTIVNDRSNGTLLLNQTGITATLSNNALYGLASDHIAEGPATAAGNTTLATRPTLDPSTRVPGAAPPQTGADTLRLVLSERPGDTDAQFSVTVDGAFAGGGYVTAVAGSATQTFSFAGNWSLGGHAVAVTLLNPQSAGSGAQSLVVNSVTLDTSTATPNIELSQASYRTTLVATTPLPGFDAAYYLAHNPDVAAANFDPLLHYEIHGWHEGRNPNALFDTNYYLTQNPDVAAAGVNPLLHYDQNGWFEGRNPSLIFSDAQPGISGANPMLAYLAQTAPAAPALTGGTAPADPLVDAAYYDRQLGASLLPAGGAAAAQAAWSYDHGGWQKGLNPNAWFDTNYYLSHNPDVAAAHIDPLLHYEINGWHEGRDPSAQFSTSKYLAAYPDVRAAGVDPLVHWVVNGQHEGRTAFAV